MNDPTWRSVAKLIGVAIAKLWLQELERQLKLEHDSKATHPLLPQPSLPTAIETKQG